MKALFLVSSLFFLAGKANSQSPFQVPSNYELKVAADYAKYEKDIIEAAKWLVETPLDMEPNLRTQVSQFVFEWVSGSPTVNVELNENIFDFDKKNPGMLIIYMASSARYVLENNYSKDMRAKHRAALLDMIMVYKSGTGVTRDKKMDKLVKSEEDGELDKWMETNLKVNNH